MDGDFGEQLLSVAGGLIPAKQPPEKCNFKPLRKLDCQLENVEI